MSYRTLTGQEWENIQRLIREADMKLSVSQEMQRQAIRLEQQVKIDKADIRFEEKILARLERLEQQLADISKKVTRLDNQLFKRVQMFNQEWDKFQKDRVLEGFDLFEEK